MRLPAPSGLWRDQKFLTFWSAQGVSEFGDRISELALPLIAVTMLDATPFEVGLLTAAVWAPNLVSLIIGSWVDQRPDKRRLMVAADLARLVVLLSLPLAWWGGVLALWQLYAIALLTGAAKVVFDTAYAAFFVVLVRRDQFLEANSKLSATRSISFMAGPAIGGVMIQVLSAPLAVLADCLSFLFSAVQLWRLPLVTAAPEETTESLFQRAWGGLRYVLRHPYLRVTLACATTVNLFNFIGSALLVLYASRELSLSPGTIGLAIGVGATGSLLGAMLAPRLAQRIGAGLLIAISTVIFTGAIAIVAVAGGPPWLRATELGIAEFVAGFAVMGFDVPMGALQASVTHDAMRSRVSGAFLTINFGVRPVGAILGGLLGSSIGPQATLLVSASGGVLAALWLLGSPVLATRSLEGLTPPPMD